MEKIQKQTLLLLGGMFGAGKTTLAKNIQEKYGPKSFNVDFGDLYKNIGGIATQQSNRGDSFRDSIWKDLFVKTISEKEKKGYELIIANSSFLISEKREFVMEHISPKLDVIALIMAIPLLTSYKRIKISRLDNSHPVNFKNTRKSILQLCNSFILGDNSDLLLPTNIYQLPKEYLAMLKRNEQNKKLLLESLNDERNRNPSWVVVPYNISDDFCLKLVQSHITDPFIIREIFEGTTANIEGNNTNYFRK